MDRAAKMLIMAAHEAWTQAGWQGSEALPLVLGTTSGGMNVLRKVAAPLNGRLGARLCEKGR